MSDALYGFGFFMLALCAIAVVMTVGAANGQRTGACQQVCWSAGAKFIESTADAECWCEPTTGQRVLLSPIKYPFAK